MIKTINTNKDYSEARDEFKHHSSKLNHIISVIVGDSAEIKPHSSIMSKIVFDIIQPPVAPYPMNDGKFLVLRNLPENDVHWNDSDPKWVGKASMSLHHAFIVPGKELSKNWKFSFNALTFPATYETITVLEDMRRSAIEFTQTHFIFDENNDRISPPDANSIGLYFHVHPTNSIHYLHMHIVDLRFKGPTFYALGYKNLSIDSLFLF
jgi:hypothetical protein